MIKLFLTIFCLNKWNKEKAYEVKHLHQFLVTLVLPVSTCSLISSHCVVLTMAMANKKLDGVVVENKRRAEEMDIHADNHVQN